MTIGIFHSSLPGYSETFILSKIRGLISKGYDVRVFLAIASHEKTDFTYINPYPIKGIRFFLAAPWVLLFLVLSRLPVVQTFWAKERGDGKRFSTCLKSLYLNAHILRARNVQWLHFTFSTFAIGREHVAAAMGAKMAVSFRGFDMGIYPLRHPGCFRKLWRTVDKVHTISDDLYALARQHGLSPEVPVKKIMPAILTGKLMRKTTAVQKHEVVSIISIGRLEWKKGFGYALQAMYALKQRGVKFTYRIVGEGRMEEELRFAIHDLQLENEVTLLRKLPHDKIFNVLHDADIYIQPSVQEGFCNALLEAQGTGLLCICSDAEGLAENVLHGQTGWVVPKRDAVLLSEKILEVIQLPEQERERVRKNAIERVSREFKLDRLLNEFTHFYTS